VVPAINYMFVARLSFNSRSSSEDYDPIFSNSPMYIVPAKDLLSKKCSPCEGGIEPCSVEHAQDQLRELPLWELSDDGKWIRRSVRFKNFVQAIECIDLIAKVAEDEGHHPDLHLTGYRNLRIDITTHAIGGLSENDFILACKIDPLVLEVMPKT
jgi:4a-hydroxytetrahydrobiopterin dehydratase